MEKSAEDESLEFWSEHVKRLASFQGKQKQYAEQNGISASKLSYYKRKLGTKAKFTKLNPAVISQAMPLSFSKAAPSTSPVDPAWLARLLRELYK